jgi:hypothetical protein
MLSSRKISSSPTSMNAGARPAKSVSREGAASAETFFLPRFAPSSAFHPVKLLSYVQIANGSISG